MGKTKHQRSSMLTWTGFLVCTALIFYSGAGLSRYGDILAEKTGLGRTWIGLVLLATVTSLPELVTGITSSLRGSADIAVGNVTGSCVFNLFTLAIIDLGREKPISSRAHFGHIISGGFGIILLSIIIFGLFLGKLLGPFAWIGPYSIIFILLYLVSMRIIYVYEHNQISQSEGLNFTEISLKKASIRFGMHSSIVVIAAIFLPGLAERIAVETGLGQTFVANVFLTISTALPELVVSFAAVRMGSIDLAIGNLLGSNIFNIVILGIDDFFFRSGPILGSSNQFNIIPALFAIIMTTVAIIGITYRAEHRRLYLTWNSLILIILYIMNLIILYFLTHR